MNNEIKEILDRLKRIDHKEYSCGFEFADSSTFDETSRCFEERKKMANYITNLQEENEIIRKMNLHAHKYASDMEGKYLIEKSRCEKAIPMLKELNIKLKDILKIGIDIKEISDIENILGGDEE